MGVLSQGENETNLTNFLLLVILIIVYNKRGPERQLRAFKTAPVAQRIERSHTKGQAEGSNPSRGTLYCILYYAIDNSKRRYGMLKAGDSP